MGTKREVVGYIVGINEIEDNEGYVHSEVLIEMHQGTAPMTPLNPKTFLDNVTDADKAEYDKKLEEYDREMFAYNEGSRAKKLLHLGRVAIVQVDSEEEQ